MTEEPQATENTLKIGDWSIEPDSLQLVSDGRAVTVQPQIMGTLLYLAARPGQVISPDELVTAIWRGVVVDDGAVYQAVAKLRKALDDDSHHPRYIETIPKKGYRLIASVEMPEAIDDISEASAQSTGWRWHHHATVIAIVLIIGAISFFVTSKVGEHAPPDLVSAARPVFLAVLPFVDMSEDGSQAYLGDGIAEELIHRLTRLPDIRVLARTSSFSVRDRNMDIPAIGQQLGVDAVLEGSVRHSGEKIWVTAQLVDVEKGFHFWSEKYERPAGDVFPIQEDIARRVAETIRGTSEDVQRLAEQRVPDPEAYRLYLMGRHQMEMRRRDSLNLGIDYLEKALNTDPDFARVHAELSFAYFLASERRYGDIPFDESIRQAEKHALGSIEIDDQLGIGWRALAAVRDDQDDDEGFRLATERAYLLDPNSPTILAQYSLLLSLDGEDEKALEVQEKAVRLDPLSNILRLGLADRLRRVGRDDEAHRQTRLAIEANPGFHVPYQYIAGEFMAKGDLENAAEWSTQAATVEGFTARVAPAACWRLVEIYFLLGEFDLAEEWMDNALIAGKSDWWVELQRLQIQLIRDDYSGLPARIDDWMRAVPDDDLYEFYHLMFGTRADARSFAGLLALLAGDEAKAMMYLQAARELPLEEEQEGDIDNLIRNNQLLAWGYMPSVSYAWLLMNSGNVAGANTLLQESLRFIDRTISETNYYTAPGLFYARASIYALMDDRDRAIDDLRLAADNGWFRTWYTKRDPVFARLRDDPEFVEIVADVDDRLAQTRDKIRQDKIDGNFKVDLDALYVRE